MRHRASHLKSFLEWLIDRPGYQHLDRSLPGYLALPRRFGARAFAESKRYAPSVSEAVRMIEKMPSGTLKQRRDRAMVAMAFLAALRADTITSLRIGHLLRHEKIVVQDSRSSRTKNGKSLRIRFFPLPEIFAAVVCSWKEELLSLGFSANDALFPDEHFLVRRRSADGAKTVPAMATTHAVSSAFEAASRSLGEWVTPHAAKHCIGNLGMEICRTPEEMKAWSMNMGHEDLAVTLRYYQGLPEERVVEIFEDFDQSDDVPPGGDLSDMELMLQYHEHLLVCGTPEFERAERLVVQRREGRDAGGPPRER